MNSGDIFDMNSIDRRVSYSMSSGELGNYVISIYAEITTNTRVFTSDIDSANRLDLIVNMRYNPDPFIPAKNYGIHLYSTISYPINQIY